MQVRPFHLQPSSSSTIAKDKARYLTCSKLIGFFSKYTDQTCRLSNAYNAFPEPSLPQPKIFDLETGGGNCKQRLAKLQIKANIINTKREHEIDFKMVEKAKPDSVALPNSKQIPVCAILNTLRVASSCGQLTKHLALVKDKLEKKGDRADFFEFSKIDAEARLEAINKRKQSRKPKINKQRMVKFSRNSKDDQPDVRETRSFKPCVNLPALKRRDCCTIF